MKRDRVYEDDDGRTIADMSDIGRQPSLLASLRGARAEKPQPPREDKPAQDRPWESQEKLSPELQRAAMWGALKAALLIGAVYVAAAAVIILLMQLVWTH